MHENIFLKDIELKKKYLQDLLKELYWNDYTYTVDEVCDLLEQKDTVFIRHFFGRILSNASFSSQALLKLIPQNELISLFQESQVPQISFQKKRFNMAKYIITGKGNPEVPAWV